MASREEAGGKPLDRGPGPGRRPGRIVAMNGSELRNLLDQGPLLGDGGMGTSLVELGVPLDACFEALNVRDPASVEG